MKPPFIRSVREAPGRQRVANASALSLIALGVVGAMLGTGVATTAIEVSDGMTWLADTRSGEVLQYNPSTKRVERSYQVGRPGDDIAVSQDSGLVALRNERTGEVITVDMSRLRAAGARAVGGPSKVLVAKGMMVLVDRDQGILRRIDPVKATDVGHTWQSSVPFADAVADQQGTVWVMVADGSLRTLSWNDQKKGFDQTSESRIQRVADDGLLAAHPAGVTVFGPRAGVIAQVGTSNDSYRQSNQLVGIAPQATDGPADLVVGTLANSSSVVIVDRGEVRQVSTAELGCVRPINPAAFNGRVYVVCQGSNKVIQLRRDGRVAGPEITTPGSGDAQPVVDEERLVLNVSGAREGIEIDREGSDQRFDRTAEAIPPNLQVETKPTDEGLEIGREQARSDLAVEPLPDQPDSGSANVNPNPDVIEDRTEVVNGASRPSATPSAEGPLPEAFVETPEPPAREPQSADPGWRESDPEPNSWVERTPAEPANDRTQVTPDVRLAPMPEDNGPTSTRSSAGPTATRHGDDASAPEPESTEDATAATTATESAPSSVTPRGNSAPTNGVGNDPDEAKNDPDESAPSGSVASDPAPTGLTGLLAAPTSSTVRMSPSASPSDPTPRTSRSGRANASVRTPGPVLGGSGATTGLAATTGLPTTPSPSPSPLAAPARLAATANGSSVTVTWAYSGETDRFEVAVGGRTVNVLGSARTATVTGNDPGTKKVTVTAVRGPIARSAETAVTIGSPATTPTSETPTGAATPLQPTSSTTGSTPTPTPSAVPPAAPTRVRGTHSGTLATVQFDRVMGATSYTISCNDYGFTTITGTSGAVACGPDSAGRAVKLGVRANNAAGSSALAEVWVDPS